MNHDLHTPEGLVGRLQPFVDGELSDKDRAEVEAQLDRDPALREMAEEQLKIRQVLRDLPRATAPQALRARVLLELDAVDREQALAAPAPSGQRFARLRAFFRGAAVLVPASAAAVALFLVARGAERPAAPPSAAAPRELAVRVLDVPEASPVRLVGYSDPRAPSGRVVYEFGPERVRIVDQQGRAGEALAGSVRQHRGASYVVDRAADGRPRVAFDVGGVRHVLSAESGEPAAPVDALLELGHLVRTGTAP